MKKQIAYFISGKENVTSFDLYLEHNNTEYLNDISEIYQIEYPNEETLKFTINTMYKLNLEYSLIDKKDFDLWNEL